MNRVWRLPFRYISPSGKFRLAQWWHFQVTDFRSDHHEYRAFMWGKRVWGRPHRLKF